MERFTEKFKDGRNIIRKGITDVFHVGVGRFFDGEAVDKLSEYEDLEEKGKLLRIHCAVGDTVYEVQDLRKRIQPYTVIAVHVSNCGYLYGWGLKDGKGVYSNVNGFSEYAIGKTVFLTLEEAETVLEELKNQK